MSVRTVVRFLAIVVLVTTIGMGLARVRTDTTPASFLPEGDPAQVATLDAARSFGGDPVVVVAESAEPAALLEGDEVLKLVRLEGELVRLADVSVVYGPATVLNQVAGQARNLLAAISGRRDALQEAARQQVLADGGSKARAKRAAEKAVHDYDVRYGNLLVQGLPAGLPTLRNPGFVRAVVFNDAGDPRQQWRFVVPRSDAVAIVVRPREGLDQAATQRLADAVSKAVDAADLRTEKVTVSGMPVIAAGLADVLKREMPIVGAVALALIALCYLLLPWLRRGPRRIIPLVTTVVATAATLALFGWLDHPVSLGVVAFLPILMGTGSDFAAYLVRGADRRMVVVTGFAAAAGFASLAFSPVPLVQDLGLALACGVALTLALGLLVAGRRAEDVHSDRRARPAEPSPRALAGRTRIGLLAVASAATIAGWAILPQLDIEAEPNRLVAGIPEMVDANHAEEVLGSSGEFQLLVRGDNVLTAESLAWMTEVQDLILRQHGDRMHPIASPPSLLAFLGPDPSPEEVEAGLAQVPGYLRTAVLRDDRRQAVLSFGVELDDVAAQRELLDEITREVPDPPDGITLDTAGLPVVAARSYELLSQHRYLHGAAGVVAAGVVLLVGLRRRTDALRAIGAAALATGWGFLAAWVLGMSLTPLTLALGSLATATACEFSVLLGAARGNRGIGRSVLVAATAATSGYLALVASDLAVIRNFGLFLALTVGLSLLASYVVRLALPAEQTHLSETTGTSGAEELAAPASETNEEVLV